MTPPTVQFIPAAAAGFDYELSGSASGSASTCGSQTTSVTSSPSVPNITRLLMYGTNCGGNVQISFADSASRDSFIGNVPNGSDLVFATTAGTFTATGFSWQTYGSTARLNAASFDSFPADLSPTQVFSLGFTI